MRAAALALALSLIAVAAQAQDAAPACAALPASLSSWSSAKAPGPDGLKLGQAYDLTLVPTSQAALPVAPAKPGGPETYSGSVTFDIATAGDYQVAAGGPVWIEVARDGAAIASTRHSHGPACTGVRKIVVFSLQPDRHVLEIAGAPEPVVRVMVARAEP